MSASSVSAGDLLAEVAALASVMPKETAERVASVLESPTDRARPDRAMAGALSEVQDPGLRQRLASAIGAFGAREPGAPLASLAWALRGAAAANGWHRDRQTLDLAWTGPTAVHTTFRRLDQALLELIQDARERLVVVTFAAHKVAEIRAALLAAMDRGVDVVLVLESAEESKGKLSLDAALGLGDDLCARARVHVWPYELRPKDAAGKPAVLHAKCAVADGQILLVSSANLTGYALTQNMELGVFVRGGDLPNQVVRHFEDLIAAKVLVRCE